MRFSHIFQERKTTMYFVLNCLTQCLIKRDSFYEIFIASCIYISFVVYCVHKLRIFSLRRLLDCEGLDYQGSSVIAINLSVKRSKRTICLILLVTI